MMKMIKKIGMIVCCMLVLFLMGCQKPAPIKIGFSAGLSGVNSEVGVGARNAVELMVEQVNQDGGINGRDVELIIKDDENDLAKVALIDQSFIDEGVLIIIGHDMSSKVATSLEVIKEQNVLMISPTISDYRVSGLEDNFIRTIPTNYDQGAALAEFALKEDKVSRVLAIFDGSNLSFGEGVVKGFEDTTGKKVDVKVIEKGIIDDVDSIANLYSEGEYEGLLLILNSKDVSYLVQRMSAIRTDVHYYCSNWAMTQDVIELGGEPMNGVRFVSMINLFSENSTFLQFRNQYLERYKTEPNFSAVYAYETAQLVMSALQKTPKMTHSALKKEILSLSAFESIQGTVNLDDFGDAQRDAYIYTIENGQFIKLK